MNNNLYTLEQVQEIVELIQKYGVKNIQEPVSTNLESSIISQQPALKTKLTLSVREAAALIGISRGKVYELIKDGEIPVIRIGQKMTIPRQAVLDWVAKGVFNNGEKSKEAC